MQAQEQISGAESDLTKLLIFYRSCGETPYLFYGAMDS
jgi:hypothetical protein